MSPSIVMNRKLGILLSTPPSHKNLETVIGLISSALRNDVTVYLYLDDEGVECIKEKSLIALSGDGLKLSVCAYGAQKKGVEPSDIAVFGGLAVLSELITACDRFIAFG
ncbi:MAG: DsrE family protein [Nitrospirae bacterium]|nr:DsrE family protein [Nitrospirota bacterium]